ncbi:methyl-accepting chemotaxis protein [Pseudomonas lutea]|uniref:Methyl-accepting chemotaxis protein n=1 Tax=Pseudomonas lutea TaxID=243924 RepID=A0ABR9A4V1_9PSED|nr:methyl-accepting chemotaxis protein [Pseudomonas lutea]MBD8121087.1 methyl-accepting chemotaxis protein [Pseudomonas lutea]
MTVRNMNIAPRAALGFGLLALLVFALGIFALVQMSSMRKQSDHVETKWLPSVMELGTLGQDLMRVRTLTLRLMLNRSPEALRDNAGKLDQLKAGLKVTQQNYAALIGSPRERELYEAFAAVQAAYLQRQDKVMELSAAGQTDEALKMINGEMTQLADKMTVALNELTTLNKQGALDASDLARAVFSSAFAWVVGMMLLTALITLLLAWGLTRSIVRPIAQALGIAQVVAAGDLTAEIVVEGRDEPARLLEALKVMQQSLRRTIMRIADSSNQLASASEELSTVTEDATRGLHQQSLEIDQAATAVNEMTAAVEEVARNAVATSEASGESDRIAQHGREQVQQTVASIAHLAEDVTEAGEQVETLAQKVYGITKVLDVIRSVAEQTNLLALNAAIEAARAGEAGRGFAVVADEVRALAHRTQSSTQEIEQLVGDIRQGTDQAVAAMQGSNSRAQTTLELAQSAGVALDEIAAAITLITERNVVIASASEEQAQVAREVDRNLTNIRDISLQSSAGANQTSAASHELSRLATDLNGMVAAFSV